MKRFFAVLAIVVLSLGLMGCMGGAAAQEANATDPNVTVESDGLGGDLAAADTLEKNETIRFNDASRIIGWEFEDNRVQVAVATNISATVEISDALAGVNEEGAVQVPKTTHDLERGVHVITFPVETVQGGSAIGVTVDSQTVRLSTALDGKQSNPLDTFGGESGLFTGVIMTVVLAAVGAWWVVRSEESGVIEA